MNARNVVPLVDSIRQQIVHAVETGMWKRGERLPSSRRMAAQLRVDVRSITRAYQQLEEEGLVEMRARSGVYIVPGHPNRPEGAPPAMTQSWLVSMLEQAVSREIPALQLSEWLHDVTVTTRLRLFVVAPTVDQVIGLRREIALYYGVGCEGATLAELAANPPESTQSSALHRSDLLIAVESTFEFVMAQAASLRIPALCVTTRPGIVGPAWEKLMQSPSYLVVSDERFGHAVADYLSGAPGAGTVRTLVAGRDDLDVIPEDAVVYATRSARETLGDTPIKGSVLPVVRVLSSESSTRLLEFIVSANLGAIRARQDVAISR